MKIIINQQKIRTRSTLSNVMSVGGLLSLLASVVLPLFLPGLANVAYFLMIAGLGISMVGIYFANRWVRKPRPEDELNKALKSLGDNCHLFHYPKLPCDHVLLTPSALFVLETVAIGGIFTYREGKWREAMTIGRGLRYIVEEHLGNPVKAAQGSERYLREQLDNLAIQANQVPIKPVVVFTHPAVELKVDGSPIPVVKADKLRKQITLNQPRLSDETYARLDQFLEKSTLNS